MFSHKTKKVSVAYNGFVKNLWLLIGLIDFNLL